MERKGILLLIFFLVSVTAHERILAQEPVDYAPKMLGKEIRQVFSIEDPVVAEIDTGMAGPEMGKYFLLTDGKTATGYVYIGRIYSCRAGGCDLLTPDQASNNSEYFDYFILFNPSGSIASVRVYNYHATHGQEVTAKSWLRKFQGYDAGYELSGKQSIDAIAGATVSSAGIISDVQIRTKYLRSLIRTGKL